MELMKVESKNKDYPAMVCVAESALQALAIYPYREYSDDGSYKNAIVTCLGRARDTYKNVQIILHEKGGLIYGNN